MKVKLEDLVVINSGHSPSSFELRDHGTIPYVKVEDMNNCSKYQRESRFYCEDAKRSVPPGSVIFPKRGAAIMNNKVRLTAVPICMDTNMMAVIPSDRVHSEFLYYTILGEKLSRIADTSTIPQINNKHINPYKILLPPLPEQKAIADLLATWDVAIEKTERLIEAKERRFRGLMQALLREKLGWRKVKIGSFLTESRIAGSNGLDAKKLTVKLYGNGVVAKNEKRLGSETTNYFSRRSGQFIYSKLDFLNGAFGVIPEELDGYESTLDLPAFDFSPEVCREWFLYFVTRPEYYTKQLGLAKGQRKARRVSPSEFLGSKIPFPPIEEQRQVSEKLSLIEREITLEKQILEQYKTQKRGLMQKLLTGEWRVVASGAKNRKEGGRGA